MPAPEQFTIEEIVRDEEWDGNDDTRWRTFEFRAEGESQSWKSSKPASDEVWTGFSPTEGGPITGWKNEGNKFGLAKNQKSSANGSLAPVPASSAGLQSPPGARTDEFARRADHPSVEARAKHTATMSAAPDFIEQMLTIGVVDQPKDALHYWELVGATIAKLKTLYPTAEPPKQGELTPDQAEAQSASVPF